MDVTETTQANQKISNRTNYYPFATGGFRSRKDRFDSASSSPDENNDMFLSTREEVDAFSSDEGEIHVGEELFMELCDAWLKTHGSRVLKKVLQDWEKIKNKKPKQYDEKGQLITK